ncbi:hypothetical protein MVEN_01600000 [Mycena venus]|uniref:Cupredoxin n=1 Tax=Mycena venus TaxID=2733690 RepID=A0A8H7CSF9_9AGAR|nr:hypothetical protein MVEN_01600000 [Mycena venus]
MRFSFALATLAAVCSVQADNILIQVGANNALTFSPSNITAKVGDTIAFQFQSKNHSITQSSFASPCVKSGVVDSGFQFVTPGQAQLPQYSFNVTDLNPLWFFCAQTNPANHCNAGMVFSVNANETSPKTFAAFQALAMGNSGAIASSVAASVVASVTSAAAGAINTATSDIASVVQQGTSILPSVISDATSVIGNGVSDATAAAGAAASDAAKAAGGLIGAGVRVNANSLTFLVGLGVAVHLLL